MSRNVVNLDALLPRADLAGPVAPSEGDIRTIKVADLQVDSLLYTWLRKPEFQRETANWSPEQVVDLIQTCVEGRIIPMIVIWQNGQSVFVIDGAHRLSALIAWVRDDYGAGDLSSRHYNNVIPKHQMDMHKETKRMVEEKIGSYSDHRLAAQDPTRADPKKVARMARLSIKGIEVQWVMNASVDQARDAFFRINQGGTKIDPVETRILRANNSAIAISARAISRAGNGHEYWVRFGLDNKTKVTEMGAKISDMLFSPPLITPIKTTDVPLAGFGYGSHTLPFAFDLINVANKLSFPDSTRQVPPEAAAAVPNDPDGTETVRLLEGVRDIAQLLCSNHAGSLGLHPLLYFYSTRGEFMPSAFFNIAAWVLDLEHKKKLERFCAIRQDFEALILDHPVIAKPAVHKLGSGGRNRPRMMNLFDRMFDSFWANMSREDVWSKITEEKEFAFLITEDDKQRRKSSQGTPGSSFPSQAKSAGYLRAALPRVLRCDICGGLMHMNGMSADHEKERREGGTSADTNSRNVHPKCNSARPGVENAKEERKRGRPTLLGK